MAEPPILYLPGASGRSTVWKPVAERLARRRTPLLVGYPGFGDAPAEPGLDSFPALVTWRRASSLNAQTSSRSRPAQSSRSNSRCS